MPRSHWPRGQSEAPAGRVPPVWRPHCRPLWGDKGRWQQPGPPPPPLWRQQLCLQMRLEAPGAGTRSGAGSQSGAGYLSGAGTHGGVTFYCRQQRASSQVGQFRLLSHCFLLYSIAVNAAVPMGVLQGQKQCPQALKMVPPWPLLLQNSLWNSFWLWKAASWVATAASGMKRQEAREARDKTEPRVKPTDRRTQLGWQWFLKGTGRPLCCPAVSFLAAESWRDSNSFEHR